MISVEEHLPRHAETIDEVREEKEVEDTYFGRLAAQSKQRAALRGVNLECTIKPGNEVETIVSFAREGQFDLLVVGFAFVVSELEHIFVCGRPTCVSDARAPGLILVRSFEDR